MTEKETLALYEKTGALLRGHFRLTSGLHSDIYLQSALVLQHPVHAEALGRALTNVLLNAVEASAPQAPISVSVRRRAGAGENHPMVEIAVRDGSAMTALRCPTPTSSLPATRSCPLWSSVTPSGPAGAACWSTSTISPRWERRPSACSTRSVHATLASRHG